MATYKIISDHTSLGNFGDTVAEKDLEGLNIQALLEGGHLTEVNVRVPKQDTKESDK